MFPRTKFLDKPLPYQTKKLLILVYYLFIDTHFLVVIVHSGKLLLIKKFIKRQFAKVSTREMQFSESKTFSRAFKLKLVVTNVPDQCSRPIQI